MERIRVKLTSEEDWMSSLPEKLWDVPLTNLSIPGEHHLFLQKTYVYFV